MKSPSLINILKFLNSIIDHSTSSLQGRLIAITKVEGLLIIMPSKKANSNTQNGDLLIILPSEKARYPKPEAC